MTFAAAPLRPFGLSDYYLTSVLTGLRSLRGPYLKQAAARIVNPLSYPRFMEYQLVMELLGDIEGKRVLDIGSPKLPVLLLARDSTCELFATDIRDYFIAPTGHFIRRMGRGARLGRDLHLEAQDARALTYADGSFDRVYSISVLEHIPGDGDAAAMREIARVLRPGGVVALTIPFDASGHRDEYVGGDVFERKATSDRTFFQRRYDERTVAERLVLPSGLALDELVAFGEPTVPFERYWNRVSMRWKVPILWAAPFLAQAFLRRLPESRLDAACGVAIRLSKPLD